MTWRHHAPIFFTAAVVRTCTLLLKDMGTNNHYQTPRKQGKRKQCTYLWEWNVIRDEVSCNFHGPFSKIVKLRAAHVPGMPGTFSCHRGLAIPTRITTRAWRTCRDACRDRSVIAVSFEVGGGDNVPGIPGACATRNFTYLVKKPMW